MDDASSPFQDATANNRDATVSGGVSFQNLAGPDGASYPDFNGSTAFATLTDTAAWSATGGKTWFFIVKPDVTTVQYLLNKWAVQYEWAVAINDTNAGDIKLYTSQLNGTNIRTGVTAGSIVSTSIWNVIAVTIDSTPAIGSTITINHNGSWKSVTLGGAAGSYADGTADMLIGARGDFGGHRLDGHAAYAGIFPALSSGTVDGIMTSADAEGWF
jgi:hypothetical protein